MSETAFSLLKPEELVRPDGQDGLYIDVPFQDVLFGRDSADRGSYPLPRLIRDDEITVSGLAHLRGLQAHGAPLQVALYGGFHGDRKDFEDAVAQYPQILDADVFVIEADWNPNAAGRPVTAKDVILDPSHDTFTQAQLVAAAEKGKLVLPADIDGPYKTDPLRRDLRKLYDNGGVKLGQNAWQAADPAFANNDDVVRQTELALSRELYNWFRQPMMVGQLGYWLLQLAHQGTYPATAAWMIGSYHLSALPEILRQQGVEVSANIVQHHSPTTDREHKRDELYAREASILADVRRTRRLTAGQVQNLARTVAGQIALERSA